MTRRSNKLGMLVFLHVDCTMTTHIFACLLAHFTSVAQMLNLCLCPVLCCWIGWLIKTGLGSSHSLNFLHCQTFVPDCLELQYHNTCSLMLLFPPVFKLGKLQITKLIQGLRPKAHIRLLYAIHLLFYSKNCVNSHRVIYPLFQPSDSNIVLLLFVFFSTEFKACPLFVLWSSTAPSAWR